MDVAQSTVLPDTLSNWIWRIPLSPISLRDLQPDAGWPDRYYNTTVSNGHIGWVDTAEVLQAPGGETNVLLATITFTSKATGSTP